MGSIPTFPTTLHTGVAQPGRRTCFGSRGSGVRIPPPVPLSSRRVPVTVVWCIICCVRRKTIDWAAAQRVYDTGVTMSTLAKQFGVGVSFLGRGVKQGLLKSRPRHLAMVAVVKSEDYSARRRRTAAAVEAAKDADVVARRTAARLASDYVVSGKLAEHARRQARAAGLASGRARAVTDETFAISRLLAAYRDCARRRVMPFDLTRDEFEHIVRSDCWYCGGPPQPMWKHPRRKSAPRLNGVDRCDNNLGYHPANVVPCCGRCNKAKHTMRWDEFLQLARQIANRHPV